MLDKTGFRFRPSINQRQARELATPSFIPDAASGLLLGPAGVVKPHLAAALVIRTIERGFGTYFIRAHDLLEGLPWGQGDP